MRFLGPDRTEVSAAASVRVVSVGVFAFFFFFHICSVYWYVLHEYLFPQKLLHQSTAFSPAEFCSSIGDECRASAVVVAAFSRGFRFSFGGECEAPMAFSPAEFCSSCGDECKASAVPNFFTCCLACSFFSAVRAKKALAPVGGRRHLFAIPRAREG